jgi:antitoxin component YwqK of YwqJK toxin-antitoxin module
MKRIIFLMGLILSVINVSAQIDMLDTSVAIVRRDTFTVIDGSRCLCLQTKFNNTDYEYTNCYFLANNLLALEFARLNGKVIGPYKEYYTTGQLSKLFNYILDVEMGVMCTWYENGKIKTIGNYKYYKNISKQKQLIERRVVDSTSFLITFEYTQRYREKEGVWKTYNYNGIIKKMESYKKGKLNGKCYYYDEAGELDRIVVYKKGKLIKMEILLSRISN